jgi:SAM-dependent methyltransferase
MNNPGKITWNSWKLFCALTGREKLWGSKIGRLLTQEGVLPTGLVLDVGTGTGEFLDSLKNYTHNVIGIDIEDYRVIKNFKFQKIGIEKYKGVAPNVIIYKQVFHLLSAPFHITEKYPKATIVVMQMPFEEIHGSSNPLEDTNQNRIKFNRLGYATEIYTITLRFKLPEERYKDFILSGYMSNLSKMDLAQRIEVWEALKNDYKGIYRDKLEILIAYPESQL